MAIHYTLQVISSSKFRSEISNKALHTDPQSSAPFVSSSSLHFKVNQGVINQGLDSNNKSWIQIISA